MHVNGIPETAAAPRKGVPAARPRLILASSPFMPTDRREPTPCGLDKRHEPKPPEILDP